MLVEALRTSNHRQGGPPRMAAKTQERPRSVMTEGVAWFNTLVD